LGDDKSAFPVYRYGENVCFDFGSDNRRGFFIALYVYNNLKRREFFRKKRGI
jgi:hypothetical protein